MQLLLAALVAIEGAAGSDLPEGAFGWMADLAGHCWSATYPDGTRDTQCYSVQYGHFLRGTIEITAGAGGSARLPYRGDSLFVWNADRSDIRVHYWSSTGTDGEMIGRIDDETITFAPGHDGLAPTRTVWTRTGPNSFRVVRQRRAGDDWSDLLGLDYARAGAAPDRR